MKVLLNERIAAHAKLSGWTLECGRASRARAERNPPLREYSLCCSCKGDTDKTLRQPHSFMAANWTRRNFSKDSRPVRTKTWERLSLGAETGASPQVERVEG